MTFRNPSFSKTQFKLQAMCALRFMCKHIIDNKYDISRGMEVRKVSDSKSDI